MKSALEFVKTQSFENKMKIYKLGAKNIFFRYYLD